MTKSTITREQLLEIIETDHVQCGEASYLARMALAAMDSEPVIVVGDDGGDALSYRRLIQSFEPGTKLYRHAQPAPVVVPEGLNPETTDLVLRFASELADKLHKAEQKYGRSTDWMKDDWYDDCLLSLWEHIGKGDPRDVAAYCAFMWYHGWVTTDYDRNVQNACRAAMLQSGNSPAQNHGWIPVSERMPVEFEAVIAFDGDYVYGEAMYSSDDGFTIDGYDPCDRVQLQNVTHWMPLPAAPQEVNRE